MQAPSAKSGEDRFTAALQRMLGTDNLTEEGMREAIAKLTPEQRHQLLTEGQDLKQDLLTKQENADDRNLYLKEVNKNADQAGMPIDKDCEFLAKKVMAFMQASIEEVPISLLLESLAATPYLVKAALAEARDGERSSLVAADLNEVEAGLSLLKVPGWREGEGTTRPPYVRRNLLLLLFHLHRERLGAITVADDARQQSDEVVAKCRRLLDVFFTYAMQCGWIKVSLAITELQVRCSPCALSRRALSLSLLPLLARPSAGARSATRPLPRHGPLIPRWEVVAAA